MKLQNLSDLKSADYNPRSITEKAFNGLKYSLEEFGDISGIVFNTQTGNLVAGHQRVKALIEKYGDLEINNFNDSHGSIIVNGETFPIRYVNWDINKEKAANIAANAQTIQGEFTSDVALILGDINLNSSDVFSSLNFSELDVPELNISVEEDDFDVEKELELITTPKSKPGDIYQLGIHRLMCGDSTKLEDVQLLMNGKKARLIFTDPPYNVDYKSPSSLSYDSTKFGGTGGKIFNDNKTDAECLQFYTDVLKCLYEVTTDDVTIYWWFANKNQPINQDAFKQAKWHFSQIVIWVKNSFVFSRGQNYHRMYEPCMVGWKKGKKHFKNRDLSNLSDIWTLDIEDFTNMFDIWYERRDVTNQYVHPTQKPVRLAERALKRNSHVNDVVVDLFGGSGSTMISCEQLKRKSCLMELDPKFCDVIVKRYMKFKEAKTVILNNQEVTF